MTKFGSYKDVERELNLKRGWIDERVRTGKIVKYKAGRLSRFDLDAVEQLVRTPPPPQPPVARNRRGRFNRQSEREKHRR
jgi:hypothetical protein